ncbi:MAG TPA: hypothetical protein PK546_00045 [Chitinophagales bacterium]|nr:hypothetical protein [Chitinophagales bacterium]
MNDVEVYIADLMLDLSPSTVVALTKQINDIAEIQRRQADYTNRFLAPWTPKNKIIAEHLNLPGNNSTRPYKWSTARIIMNGITITNFGIAILTETLPGEHYEYIIYAGNYDLFSKINNKYITELDWSDLEHVFNYTNWKNSWTNTEGFIYALAETLDGRLTYYTNATPSGSIRIDLGKQFPWVYVKTIWDRIFSEASLEYEGDIFSEPLFTEEIVFAGRDYTKDVTTPFDKFQGNTNYTPPYLQWLFATPPISPVLQKIDIGTLTIASANFNISTDKYTVAESGNYQFTMKANMGIEAIEFVRFKIYVNGVLRQTESYAVNIANAFYTTYNFELTTNILVAKNDEVEFYYELDNIFTNYAIAVRIGYFIITVMQTSREVIQYGSTIEFSKILPKIKQLDFLKAIMQQYGMIYKINNNGTYSFITINELIKGTAGKLDYTKKLSREKSETYSIGNTGKKNYFKYQYSENDKLGTAYADKEINIDIDNLQDEAPLIDSIIQAAGDYLFYDNWQKIASVHAYNNSESNETLPPIYKLNENNKLIIARKVIHNVDYYTVGNGNIYLTFEFNENQAVAQFKDYHWQELTDLYYQEYIKIIQKPVKKIVQFWLTPIDIYFLDMFKIIYLEQYQSYFYLNKVNNFLPGKLSDCELIKIN